MSCTFVFIAGLLTLNFLADNNQQTQRLNNQNISLEDIQINSKSIDNSFIEINKYEPRL
jgi:hypothetical protein